MLHAFWSCRALSSFKSYVFSITDMFSSTLALASLVALFCFASAGPVQMAFSFVTEGVQSNNPHEKAGTTSKISSISSTRINEKTFSDVIVVDDNFFESVTLKISGPKNLFHVPMFPLDKVEDFASHIQSISSSLPQDTSGDLTVFVEVQPEDVWKAIQTIVTSDLPVSVIGAESRKFVKLLVTLLSREVIFDDTERAIIFLFCALAKTIEDRRAPFADARELASIVFVDSGLGNIFNNAMLQKFNQKEFRIKSIAHSKVSVVPNLQKLAHQVELFFMNSKLQKGKVTSAHFDAVNQMFYELKKTDLLDFVENKPNEKQNEKQKVRKIHKTMIGALSSFLNGEPELSERLLKPVSPFSPSNGNVRLAFSSKMATQSAEFKTVAIGIASTYYNHFLASQSVNNAVSAENLKETTEQQKGLPSNNNLSPEREEMTDLQEVIPVEEDAFREVNVKSLRELWEEKILAEKKRKAAQELLKKRSSVDRNTFSGVLQPPSSPNLG